MKRKVLFEAKSIPVKLDAATLKKLDEVAERIGEQRSTVMRMAMRLGLEALTNTKVSEETIRRLAMVQTEQSPTDLIEKRKAG